MIEQLKSRVRAAKSRVRAAKSRVRVGLLGRARLAALVCATAATACGSSGSKSGDAARADASAGDAGDGADVREPDEAGADAPGALVEPARDEHAVFSLGANRLLAHAHRGGALFIDAGSPGFAKYTRFGVPVQRWKLRQLRDGVKVAVADRLAAIEVPLAAERVPATRAIHLRVYTPVKRKLTVKVNGRRSAGRRESTLRLEPGWQTATAPIAEGRLTPGENFIALEFGRGKPARVAWIQVGGDAPADGAEALASPARYDAETDTFELEPDGGISWYVQVPEGGHLVADVTALAGGAGADGDGDDQGDDDAKAGPGACAVRMRTAGAGAALAGALQGRGDRVDLGALAGQVVRLELTAVACPAGVRIQGAALTVPGPAPRYVRPPDASPPRYLVLWVMDAMRADRVRPFQPGARAEVPAFEKLAAKGVVFRQYYVQGNESQTSHSSVWTSLYPAVHEVRTAGNGGTYQLRAKKFDTLPQLIEALDFQTIGVTGNGYVTKGAGYGVGFEVWHNLMRERKWRRGWLDGAKVYNQAIALLGERVAKGRAMLFLGTVDTHAPWVGHQPWLSRYDPGPYDGVHVEAAWPGNLGIVRGSMKCNQVPKKRDIQRIFAIYDSAVSYQDQLLGTMVAQLEEWGILDQTMIVVTSDHGEEFWEEGRCGHGASLRESLVRVPLLVHYPPLLPGGVVVTEGAEGVDVLPTILDALGQEPLEQAQGSSLIPLAHGEGRGYVRPSYASQYEYAHAMRLGDWKLRVGRTGVAALHNVAMDPDERQNLARTLPAERRMLTDALSMFLIFRREWDKREWGVASNMTQAGAAALERVEAD